MSINRIKLRTNYYTTLALTQLASQLTTSLVNTKSLAVSHYINNRLLNSSKDD